MWHKKKRVKRIEEKRQTTRTDADVDGMEWDGMVVYYNTLVSTTSMKSVTNRFFGTWASEYTLYALAQTVLNSDWNHFGTIFLYCIFGAWEFISNIVRHTHACACALSFAIVRKQVTIFFWALVLDRWTVSIHGSFQTTSLCTLISFESNDTKMKELKHYFVHTTILLLQSTE